VFLGWMNLVYQGMDMYAKTWLQFAFPISLGGISALFIFLSNRFIVISMLFGDKSVHVLSTHFLLAYAKLQHTIIAALSFTYISYPDGKLQFILHLTMGYAYKY